MTFAQEQAEVRSVLESAWKGLPARFHGPTQFLGRQYAGCGATIGAMPKCDFSCAGCYLNAGANHAKAAPVAELKDQLGRIRSWLGRQAMCRSPMARLRCVGKPS